jgi:hypothetical protein
MIFLSCHLCDFVHVIDRGVSLLQLQIYYYEANQSQGRLRTEKESEIAAPSIYLKYSP